MNDTVFRLPGYWEVIQTGPSELILKRNPPWGEGESDSDCDWVEDILEMTPEEMVNQIACMEPEQQTQLIQQLSTVFNALQGPNLRRAELQCPTRGKRLTQQEKDTIIDMYVNQKIINKSLIARKLGTTPQTVMKVLDQAGIPRRTSLPRRTRGWMYY
jgi:agmatine/peptidylarginine deiminase